VEPVVDQTGDLIGAAVWLSPDEVEELLESGSVEITLDQG